MELVKMMGRAMESSCPRCGGGPRGLYGRCLQCIDLSDGQAAALNPSCLRRTADLRPHELKEELDLKLQQLDDLRKLLLDREIPQTERRALALLGVESALDGWRIP